MNEFKKIIPLWIKAIVYLWRRRYLLQELKKINIESSGISEDGFPWVRLKDGMIFYGFFPTPIQRSVFRYIKKSLPELDEDTFWVATEIVNRYLVPRSLPGQTIYDESRYHPLRDPLNDFHFSNEEKKDIAKFFRPTKGETFVDVGAYLGYGTLRIAKMVGSSGKVIAIEADPDTYTILQRNITENNLNHVTCLNKGISNTSGDKLLFQCGGTGNSLNKDVLENVVGDVSKTCSIEVDTLDKVLSSLNIDNINILNITVNGGEPEVLEGVKEILMSSKNIRITLAGWYIKDGVKICDIIEPFLISRNFKVIKGKLGRLLAWKVQ